MAGDLPFGGGIRFNRERAAEGPLITGLTAQGFKLDDAMIHDGALLITPLWARGWDAPALAALTPADVESALALDPAPEFLLFGTGSTMRRPPPAFVAALEARGFGVEAMDSRAAARAWGVLRAEGRWIAGALLPL